MLELLAKGKLSLLVNLHGLIIEFPNGLHWNFYLIDKNNVSKLPILCLISM